MTESNQNTYDKYSAAALQALISKLPLLDVKAEFGQGKTPQELDEIIKELCRSAHGYATMMMITRDEFIVFLEQKNL